MLSQLNEGDLLEQELLGRRIFKGQAETIYGVLELTLQDCNMKKLLRSKVCLFFFKMTGVLPLPFLILYN